MQLQGACVERIPDFATASLLLAAGAICVVAGAQRLQCTAPLRLVRRFCVHLRRPPLVSVELCEFPYLLSLHCLLKTYHGGIPADRCVFGAQIMLLYVIRGHNTNPWTGNADLLLGSVKDAIFLDAPQLRVHAPKILLW